MSAIDHPEPRPVSPRLRRAGLALGFALGGFFDGILLHQVLQWHHLLSGLEGGRFGDLRVQILADGLFHAFMYVVGAAGLVLLWRARAAFARPGGDRPLLAHALIGFGVWHVLDGIVSHWLLGLHRIRMDAAMPLVWDILWFALFGLGFVGLGLRVLRGGGGGGFGGGRRGAAPAGLALLAVLAGAASLLPPAGRDSTATLVVFGPSGTPAGVMAAATGIGARLVWANADDTVWALDLPDGADASALYRGGAWLVSDTLPAAGCLGWFRPDSSPGA